MRRSQNLLKTVLLTITLTTACSAKSQTANSNTSGDSSREEGQTTFICEGDGTQVSQLIQEILVEINFLRQDPAGYAEMLKTYKTKYASASDIQDAIEELVRTPAVRPLVLSKGLSLAAQELVTEQGTTNAWGHISANGETPYDRMDHHGQWDGSAAENIGYGMATAVDIVADLVIDRAIPDKGHRRNLLDPAFGVVGIAFGPHADPLPPKPPLPNRTMTVMDFATSYVDAK